MTVIDAGVVGTATPPHTAAVERGRLRFFAKATGQSDPVYTDLDAARAAGHPDLPVPPTFLFCLNMDVPHPAALLEDLGIDIRTILHGGQSFTYHAPAYAGDELTFATAITGFEEKKGGALKFLHRTTEVTRGNERIATLVGTIVLREIPKKGAAA